MQPRCPRLRHQVLEREQLLVQEQKQLLEREQLLVQEQAQPRQAPPGPRVRRVAAALLLRWRRLQQWAPWQPASTLHSGLLLRRPVGRCPWERQPGWDPPKLRAGRRTQILSDAASLPMSLSSPFPTT
jgi:hypothetical protein